MLTLGLLLIGGDPMWNENAGRKQAVVKVVPWLLGIAAVGLLVAVLESAAPAARAGAGGAAQTAAAASP